MKKAPCLIILVLMFHAGRSVAQTTCSRSDSLAVFSLIDKAELFFTDSKYDSALFYCGKAESLSMQLNFKKGLAYTLIEVTDIYIDKDELDKAETNAAAVNKIGLQLKDSLITAVSWMQMAQVKMYNNQFDEAIPLFVKSLQYYLAKHPSRYSALAFNDLGYTWGRKGELSKQANCLMQSISIYESYFPEKYGELGTAFNNLSTVYYGLNQMEKAIEYARKSLVYREKSGDIARLSIGCCNLSQFYNGINNEEAEKYLQLCIKYALQSKQESRVIHSYVTAANLYGTIQKPAEALEFELKAISLLEKSRKDPVMLARRYMAAGTLCRKLNKDSSVILSYYSKSLDLLKSIPDKFSLRDFYFQLSGYYNENKNYSAAYEYYKKYVLYKDSIISEKTKSSIAEIATRYETEKKDNEIIRLNTFQRIKQLEIEKQKAMISSNNALAKQKENEISLLVQQQQLQDFQMKEKDESIEKQMLLARNTEQQLKLSQKERELNGKQLHAQKQLRNGIVAGALLLLLLFAVLFNRYQIKKKLEEQIHLQEMRNSISRNLHDDIGASLSNINILNELARRNAGNPARANEYLNKAAEDIQHVSESLSDIVWNINPRYDELNDLFVRMKRYAADMMDGKNISYEINFPRSVTDIKLDMDKRRDLYLIFKEAVNNLVKYSKATLATVEVAIDKDKIRLMVKDNGVGFDHSFVAEGNGLRNMQQRAAIWNALLEIKSSQGSGTMVLLEMPLL